MNRFARLPIVLFWAASCCLPALRTAGQETLAAGAPPAVVRAYVPADAPALWPRGEGPLVPVPADEFESLLRRAALGERSPQPPAVTWESCHITAALLDEELLQGTFRLRVDKTDGGAEWLPLAPCNVAIHDAAWRSKSLRNPVDPPAGDSPLAEPSSPRRLPLVTNLQGEPCVEIPGRGEMTISWSLRGRRDTAGDRVWAIELPWAEAQSLELSAPLGKRVSLEGATLLGEPIATATDRVWSYALSPRGGCVLRVSEAAAAAVAEPLRVRARVTHDVRVDRLEVEARLQLEAPPARAATLVLLASPELEIDECRVGNTALAWHDGGLVEAWRRWEIPLTGAPTMGAEPILVRGHSATALDRPWRLPTIAPDDSQWVEATHLVRIERPLTVDHWTPHDCRLSRFSALPATHAGEAYEAQCFGPRAGLEATLSTRRPNRRVRWTCAIHTASRALEATVTAQVQQAEGDRTAWPLVVRAPWEVKRVLAAETGDDLSWRMSADTAGDAGIEILPPAGEGDDAPRDIRIELARELNASTNGLSGRELWPVCAPRDQVESSWLVLPEANASAWQVAGSARILAIEPTALGAAEQTPGLTDAHGWLFDARLPLPERMLERRREPQATAPAGVQVDTGPIDAAQVEERLDGHDSDAAGAAVVVWRMHVESKVGPRLAPRQRAQLWISTQPGASLTMQLPPHATPIGAQLDGQPTTWREVGESRQALEFQLGSKSECQLVVEYELPTANWRLWSRVDDPAPTPAAPVLAKRWTVWLPPAYHALHQQSNAQPDDWLGRLFGPLRRPAHVRAWSPVLRQVAGWRLRLDPSRGEALQRAQSAEAAFGTAANSRDNAKGDWGELLRRASVALAQSRLELSLDQAALDDLGLRPQQSCAAAPGRTDLARGRELLTRSQLALLLDGDQMVLTSAAEACRPSANTEMLTGATALVVHSASESRGSADSERALAGRVTVAQWLAQPRTVWADNAPALIAADVSGWNAWPLDGLSQTGVLVVHAQLAQGLWAAVGLIAAAASWWLFNRRPRHVAWLALACAVGVLLAPRWLAAPFAAALWGCLAVAIVWLCRQWSPTRTSQLQRAGTWAGIAWLATAWAAGSSAVYAQNPMNGSTAQANSTRPAPQQVLIPVDENRRPNGQPYHVPAGLYQELLRRAQADDPRRDMVIERAHYRAVLERDQTTGKVELARLTAQLDAVALDSGQPRAISLQRTDHAPLERVTINGVEQAVAWDEAAGALRTPPLAAGRFQIEAELIEADEAVESNRCGLSIPPCLTARLEVDVPDASIEVQAPTAWGEVSRSADGRKVTAQLGGGQRLELQWRAAGPEAAPRVEQLWWLQLQPGSVVWRLKLRCDAGQESLDRLALRYDAGLQWLAAQPTGGDDAVVAPLDDQPLTHEARWKNPRPATREVEMAWLVRGALGVGPLSLPRIEIPHAQTTRVWLAASVDPSLDYTSIVAEHVEPEQFLQRWGQTDDVPTLARQLDPRLPQWELSALPKPPAMRCQEQVEWLIAAGAAADEHSAPAATAAAWATLRYAAEVGIERGARFHYELTAPPGLVVRRVSVKENDVEQSRRWRIDEAGRLTIWLKAPATETQTLLVEGDMAVDTSSAWQLPRVALREAEGGSQETRVFRLPSAQVTLETTATRLPLAGAPAARVSGAAIPVAAWDSSHRDSSETAPATLHMDAVVAPPQVEQRTSLQFDGEGWRFETALAWSNAPGAAPPLCLQVPAELQPILEFSPAMNHRWLAADDDSPTTTLALMPPLDETTARCTLRCRLASEPGGFSLPRVVPLSDGQASHTLVIPWHVGLHEARWETRQLEPTDLPPSEPGVPWTAESHRAYRVVGDDYAAQLDDLPSDDQGPHVELAWLELAAAGHESLWTGLASFDVVARGAKTLPLQVPQGVRLQQVFVEGVALPHALPVVDQIHQAPLSGEALPQRVDVLFTFSKRGASRGSIHELAPTVADWPVRRAVLRAWQPGAIGTETSSRATGAADLAHVRLAHDAAVLAAAVDTADQADLAAWFAQRQSTFAEDLTAAQLLLAAGRGDAPARPAKSANLAPLVAALREQLTAAGFIERIERLPRSPSGPTTPSQLWQASVDPRWSSRVWQANGRLPAPNLSNWIAPGSVAAFAGLWGRSLACLVCALVAWWVWRGSRWLTALLSWPKIVWFTTGVFAWGWLQPVWLGPVLLILGSGAILGRRLAVRRVGGRTAIRWATR